MARDGAPADPRLTTEMDRLTAQLDRVQREKASAEQAGRATRAELERARTRSGPATAPDHEQVLQVLAMAEHTADTHLGEAERAAHDLLSDARSAARQVTGDALAEASALEQDARQRHHEAMGGLDALRTAAEDEIEDLEAFEREYHSRLKVHVEGQLRDLGTEPDVA